MDIEKLKMTTNSYLVYIEGPDGSVLDMSIWTREIREEDDQFIGVYQTWKNQDRSNVKTLKSLVAKDTFAPIFHQVESNEKLQAYSYQQRSVVGTDTVENNAESDFILELNSLSFNFELDLELLRILPYRNGVTFSIPFYHPGSNTPPKSYDYEVRGKETLSTPVGDVMCWVLTIEYSEKNAATFWISETSREFMKMEETYGPIRRCKKLLF